MVWLIALIFLFFPYSVSAQQNIYINQFLPNPSNEDDEWIELFNPNSEEVNISGYTLDDEPTGGSKPFIIPSGKTISANNPLRFAKSETGLALNNSKQKDQPFADMVRLLDKSGIELDSITYYSTTTDVPQGHSTPSPVPSLTPLPTPQSATNTPSPTLKPTRTPQLVVSTIQPTIISSPSPTIFTASPSVLGSTDSSKIKNPNIVKKVLPSFTLIGCGIISLCISAITFFKH